ncbi:hypothetical protein R1flu_002094 [Riccia fluitans]|uniref:Uncharacterized protein n=1 Tax=Riccia fluitans TaxID=41844 RepID=A0ABD1Y904_9MARC
MGRNVAFHRDTLEDGEGIRPAATWDRRIRVGQKRRASTPRRWLGYLTGAAADGGDSQLIRSAIGNQTTQPSTSSATQELSAPSDPAREGEVQLVRSSGNQLWKNSASKLRKLKDQVAMTPPCAPHPFTRIATSRLYGNFTRLLPCIHPQPRRLLTTSVEIPGEGRD